MAPQRHRHEACHGLVLGPSRVDCSAISPGPGSGTMSSTVRTLTGVPSRSSCDRLVVDEPGRRVHWHLARPRPAGRSRGTAEVRSSRVRPAESRSAWSMTQLLPYLPGCPLAALEVGGALDAADSLGDHDDREVGIDGRDVSDRDVLAAAGMTLVPSPMPMSTSPCPMSGHEVRVGLVVECDVEPGVRIVAGLLRPHRRARTGRSGCSPGRPSGPSSDATRRGWAAGRSTGRRHRGGRMHRGRERSADDRDDPTGTGPWTGQLDLHSMTRATPG